MSNAELRKLNERQNLEFQYKRQNSKIKKVAAIIGGTAATLGAMNAIKNTSPQLISSGKNAIENIKYQTWLFTHR